jgi:hypothetical protein
MRDPERPQSSMQQQQVPDLGTFLHLPGRCADGGKGLEACAFSMLPSCCQGHHSPVVQTAPVCAQLMSDL